MSYSESIEIPILSAADDVKPRKWSKWTAVPSTIFVAMVVGFVYLYMHNKGLQTIEVEHRANFEAFLKMHNKVYGDEREYEHRFRVWAENYNTIQKHNNQNHGYTMKIHEDSDLTNEEVVKKLSCLADNGANGIYKNSNAKEGGNLDIPFDQNREDTLLHAPKNFVPDHVDWRKTGCVGAVKNQKQCGSCWAFAAVGAVEISTCIQTGNSPVLSEQVLVDCDTLDFGCGGGFSELAQMYVMNYGLCYEHDYPYTATDQYCSRQNCTETFKMEGFRDVPAFSKDAIKNALATFGSVVIAVAVDSKFQSYHEGVFSDPHCGLGLNHAVLLVGYGVEPDGTEYFWLRNSWGGKWGMDGYMKIKALDNFTYGTCGIYITPFIVT